MDSNGVALAQDEQPERTDATAMAESSGTGEQAEGDGPQRRRRREYAVSVDDEKIELKKAHRIVRNNTLPSPSLRHRMHMDSLQLSPPWTCWHHALASRL